MADQIRQEIMQLAGQNPAFLQQARAQLQELANDPDIQANELPEIISALEGTLRDPSNYSALIARFEREGVIDPGDLPSQFDPQVVVALLVTFYLLQDELSGAEGNPRGFARGGLALAAEKLRRAGRGGDTILAHINPEEARLLKAAGGSGTINPETGLPEFLKLPSLKKLVKVVAPIALSVVAPGLGTAIGAAIGLSGAAASIAGSALIGGTVSKLSGGSFTQGALGGAIGGGLGGAVGSAANEALGLGLGGAGQTALGGALTGAAQGALSGTGALQGALGGGLSAYGGSIGGATGRALAGLGGAAMGGGDALRGALGSLAGYGAEQFGGSLGEGMESNVQGALKTGLGRGVQAGVSGGDAGKAFLSGAVQGSGVGRDLLRQFLETRQLSREQREAEEAAMQQQQAMGQMPIDAAPGTAYAGGATARGPFTPIPGTFNVAPADQVKLWAQGAGGTGSMQSAATQLPVFSTVGDQNYVQRFIKSAETGGYMNPDWATYRPGVQIMASGNPTQLPGEAGAQAYVPNFRTPGTADTVMLVNTGQYNPQAAAQVLGHELYHTKQPGSERDVYAGTPGGLQTYQQNLSSVIPYLQEKYGYTGAYDTQTAKVPLMERMADLQSFQFNKGVDFAADPVFQQKVFGNDPYARAAWNASTVERTTRLDPRDLPPGKLTSSDFGPGGAPLTFQAQEWLKKRGFAQGGLAQYKERLNGR